MIVCHSPLRDVIKAHRKPLLLSYLNNKQIVMSVSMDLVNDFRKLEKYYNKIPKSERLFKDIDNMLFDRFKVYQIDDYYRMTITKDGFVATANCYKKARPLEMADKELLLNTGQIPKRGRKFREERWRENIKSIKGGRFFGVLDQDRVKSWASVDPIECGGGNINVWTAEKHRKKGYGKMVVFAAVQWCLEHDILPIYWVRQDNKASIALAKSLGFAMKNKEIVVSHWPGDAFDKYKKYDRS